MRYFAIGLAAVAMLACRTHMGDDPCDPACGPADEAAFADCVANGTDADGDVEACPAGNRMCCALAQHCIGELDDQTVTNDMVCSDLPTITIEYCPNDCDPSHELRFEECVTDGGFAMCFAGDPELEECCAETIGCLGELGGFLVVSSADCCETDDDCLGADEHCDLSTGQCRSTSPICGDFIEDLDEECDEGPTGSESLDCTYGELSCLRCTSECVHVEGEPHYCGDETLDSPEECDPPGVGCRMNCTMFAQSDCRDSAINNDETDLNCGGPSCDQCFPGQACLDDRDCTTISTGGGACGLPSAICSESGRCIEVECHDGDDCTADSCRAATGECVNDPIDADRDDVVCALDCDDDDPNIFPGSTPRPCDGIDDDCDGDMDEGTACP